MCKGGVSVETSLETSYLETRYSLVTDLVTACLVTVNPLRTSLRTAIVRT